MEEQTQGTLKALTKSLQDSAATNELIFDTLDGFNPILNSVTAQENVRDMPEAFKFIEMITDTVDSIKNYVVDLVEYLQGNKLQDEENRREMIDILKKKGSDTPPPLPIVEEKNKGFVGGLLSGILGSSLVAGFSDMFKGVGGFMPKFVTTAFAPILTFFKSFSKIGTSILSFGKNIVKLAGPIGIAISIITALIGAIKGGMKGYAEDGIVGAIKGAVTGAIDMLIGSIVKGLAEIVSWVLDKIGFSGAGSLLGPLVTDFFDTIYKIFGGYVDVLAGLFTLDSKKFVGGLKQIFSSIVSFLPKLGEFVKTFIKEAIPVLAKAVKAFFVDLPRFIAQVMPVIIDFVKNDLPVILKNTWVALSTFVSEVGVLLLEELEPYKEEAKVWFYNKIVKWVYGIKNWVAGLFGGSAKDLDKLGEDISETIDDFLGFFEDVIKTIESIFNGINNAIDGVLDAIPDAAYEFAGVDRVDRRAEKTAQTKLKRMQAFDLDGDGVLNEAEYKAYEKAEIKAGRVTPEMIISPNEKTASPADIKNYLGIPSENGAYINQASKENVISPIIINQMGGNVSNMNTSNVSNNTTPLEPIISGSAMGFASV